MPQSSDGLSPRPRHAPGAPDPRALQLRVEGLSPSEQDLLGAMLHLLRDRIERRWELGDAARPDLYLRTRDCALPAPDAALSGVVVRDGDAPTDTETLSLTTPLRVMAVLDLLNAAQDRLAQRQAEARAASAAEDDDKALAAALARLFDRRAEHALRVRVVGFGTLHLCPRRRVFCVDFPLQHLPQALQQHRFVITQLPAESAELEALIPQARPLDEVLWACGLATPWPRAAQSGTRFKLRRWPDLPRLVHRPEHIQACAAMMGPVLTMDEIATASGLSAGEVAHLLHACELCALVDSICVDALTAAPTQALQVPAPDAGLGGLFRRLWRRFGG